MADEIKGKYPSSLICSVNKYGGTSKYAVNLKVYSWSTLEAEREEEFTIDVGTTDDGIVGVYQTTYSDTYLTDTVVRNKPIDAHNLGLSYFFANCPSFTTLKINCDEDGDVIASYGAVGGMAYAFYHCTALEEVYFSQHAEASYPGLIDMFVNTNCESMFEGCSSLTTIHGYFRMSSADFTKCKDMFKGCTSLTGVKLTNGVGEHDINASLTVGGITYDHAYEYLGLNAGQFEIVTEGS